MLMLAGCGFVNEKSREWRITSVSTKQKKHVEKRRKRFHGFVEEQINVTEPW